MSDSATSWTVACQAPLFKGFPRQEYWCGLLCPPTGGPPDSEIKPTSLGSPATAGRFFTTCATWETSLALKTAVKSNYFIPYIDLEFPFSKELEILDILIGHTTSSEKFWSCVDSSVCCLTLISFAFITACVCPSGL